MSIINLRPILIENICHFLKSQYLHQADYEIDRDDAHLRPTHSSNTFLIHQGILVVLQFFGCYITPIS